MDARTGRMTAEKTREEQAKIHFEIFATSGKVEPPC